VQQGSREVVRTGMMMSLQKQLMTKGRKWKLQLDEMSILADKPVYKWQQEWKTWSSSLIL